MAALEEAEASGTKLTPARVRRAIRSLNDQRLGEKDAYILGDFYAKQVDVVISSWRRGPELLVSTKTMFSSYRNNFKNRHEEAVGEVDTLRRRHPMAAMGFAFLVRSNIYDGEGDYALLQNILTRLRTPGRTFDATMLLVAEWDDADPAGTLRPLDQPDPQLGAGIFFADLSTPRQNARRSPNTVRCAGDARASRRAASRTSPPPRSKISTTRRARSRRALRRAPRHEPGSASRPPALRSGTASVAAALHAAPPARPARARAAPPPPPRLGAARQGGQNQLASGVAGTRS